MILISTLQNVFTDEVFKICIEPNLAFLQLTWRQHPTSTDYRRGYRQAIVVALEYKVKYWLTNSQQVAYLHLADQHWMYNKMGPLLKGGKLSKLAIVLQPETLLMTDRTPVSETVAQKSGFNLEFFLDMYSAQMWLLEEGHLF